LRGILPLGGGSAPVGGFNPLLPEGVNFHSYRGSNIFEAILSNDF